MSRNFLKTEEGYLFFSSAVNMLDILDTTKHAIASMKQIAPIMVDGQLQDPAISGLLSTAIMMNSTKSSSPIKFNRNRPKAPLALLKDGEVDILIMGETIDRLEQYSFEYELFTTTSFVAVMDSTHPLAQRKQLTMGDLRNETLVQFLDDYSRPGWRAIQECCRNHGFEPKCRPVLVQSVAEQLAVPLRGCILVFPTTSKELRFITSTSQRTVIPIVDADAHFSVYVIYKAEDKMRLSSFLLALEETRKANNLV